MQLLVVRHAIAEDRKADLDDHDRALTRTGQRKFRGVVQGLRELGWRLDRTLTSPWRRARETADLLEPLRGDAVIETSLLCQSPREELLAQIAEQTAADKRCHATAVVGHEPWLGELVAWLAFGDPQLCENIVLKKGGVIWLDGTAVPHGMRLRAMWPPRTLRTLAGC